MSKYESDCDSASDADSDSESVAESDDDPDSYPAFDHEYDRVRGQTQSLTLSP